MIDPRPLGDGLVLRTAGPGDAAELADLNGSVHTDADMPPDGIAEWTLELFEIPPPGFRAEDDILVVEDTTSGRLVSSLCLLPQEWSYSGVPTAAGQPELVGTHPDYRRRGLIRRLMEAIHARSADAGHQWQFIGGIAWYYRQFGYTYALDLPPFPVWRWQGDLPEAPPGFAIRPASVDDVPFLVRTETAAASSGSWFGCRRDADGWTYELTRRPRALPTGCVLVIERTAEGADPEPIGYAVHGPRLRAGNVSLWVFELLPGHAWLDPTAAVLAHLAAWGSTHPDGPAGGVRLLQPHGHPARRCVVTRLAPSAGSTYGFYVRVPDLAAFLRTVGPALEARVADSPAVGITGELAIDLYTEQIRLCFDDGGLTKVDRDVPAPAEDETAADLRLPHEAFLHLLMGNRTLAEVEPAFPDCEVRTDRGGLLGEVLFPRMALTPWAMG